jgi:hypothetical protein
VAEAAEGGRKAKRAQKDAERDAEGDVELRGEVAESGEAPKAPKAPKRSKGRGGSGAKKQKKNKNILESMQADRLLAYGIEPKKFHKKLKYGQKEAEPKAAS